MCDEKQRVAQTQLYACSFVAFSVHLIMLTTDFIFILLKVKAIWGQSLFVSQQNNV